MTNEPTTVEAVAVLVALLAVAAELDLARRLALPRDLVPAIRDVH